MNQGRREDQVKGYWLILKWTIRLGIAVLLGYLITSCKSVKQPVLYSDCAKQARIQLAQDILLSDKFDLSRKERTALDSITYFNYIN